MSNETQHTPANVRERVKEPTQAQIDDACMWYRHDFGLLSEKERDSVRFEARQWFRAWGKALSNGDDYAALLRTPRGEGEAWRAFLAAMAEFEAAANLWADPEGPSADDMARLDRARQRVIECAGVLAALRSDAQGEDTIPVSALRSEIAQLKARGLLPYLAWARLCALAGGWPVGEDTPAALRSEAQGEEADALDLIRWAEARAAALEPVAGNIMPPGTYACYAGDADDPYMGPGILGAIRAARLGEGGGDG